MFAPLTNFAHRLEARNHQQKALVVARIVAFAHRESSRTPGQSFYSSCRNFVFAALYEKAKVPASNRRDLRQEENIYPIHPDEIGNRFLTFAIDSRTPLKLFFLNLVSISTDCTLHGA